mmetsp:Transcript_17758/g.50279  ORF Transcript_17758/g.50279 Transcript_17758/m.50279 type:complete len:290 (+) Transcript_17758:217-1086(+)
MTWSHHASMSVAASVRAEHNACRSLPKAFRPSSSITSANLMYSLNRSSMNSSSATMPWSDSSRMITLNDFVPPAGSWAEPWAPLPAVPGAVAAAAASSGSFTFERRLNPPTRPEAWFLRSSSAFLRIRGSMDTVQSWCLEWLRTLRWSLSSQTTFWMFFAGSSTLSWYDFRQARTSVSLKVETSSRSLGPVPLGRCRATISRQRASLLPRPLSRRNVADIFFRLSVDWSRSLMDLKRMPSSSSRVPGCHRGPRFRFSGSLFFRHHRPQNSGVLTDRGGVLPTSSGNSSV